MSSHDRDLSVIRHISDYCDQIEEALEEYGRDKETFMRRKVFRNAVALCILQIGELVGHLSDEFRSGHSEIPWKQVKQMRNIVAHNYGKLDIDDTWKTVTDDIPTLKAFCAGILDAAHD